MRTTRAAGQIDALENQLNVYDLRKRDEDSLGALLRAQTVVVRQGAFKFLTDSQDVFELVTAGDLFGPDVHFALTNEQFHAKSLLPELTLCGVPHAEFEKLMIERPALNSIVVRLLAHKSMMARVSFHWAKKSLRERALLTLAQLRTRFGVRYGQFKMIDLPLTKIDLASLMSTVQESAVRVLSEFREDGLISQNGKRIVILDNDRLDRMCEDIRRRDKENSLTGGEGAPKENSTRPSSKD